MEHVSIDFVTSMMGHKSFNAGRWTGEIQNDFTITGLFLYGNRLAFAHGLSDGKHIGRVQIMYCV